MTKTERFDVMVLGAGASGLMCAATAARRGQKVLVLESTQKPGNKILVSGGGRCNFSNADVGPEHYISDNPHFCKSALSRYSPQDFCALLARHHVRWHEEDGGKLFCDDAAAKILNVLLSECREAGVKIQTGCGIRQIEKGFCVATDAGDFTAAALVVATGGISWPKLGASDFGYEIAQKYGLKIILPRPALVPLVFDAEDRIKFGELAGLSLRARVSCADAVFEDDVLFTHRGLSGPAVLQISLYWRAGDAITIDLLPKVRLEEIAARWKREHPKAELKNLIGEIIPKRLVQKFIENSRPVNQITEREMKDIAASFHNWRIVPARTEGFEKAEVTRGGVDTTDISSKTFEAHNTPGLYFIGEVLDVIGWLGGFNLHWAWASGHCCGLCC